MQDDDSPLDRLLDLRLQLPLEVHRFLMEHGDDLDDTVLKAVEAYLARHDTADPHGN